MAHDAGAGVSGQDPLEPSLRRVGPIGNDNHPCVDRIPDSDPATVMDRDPTGAARRIEQGIEQRPVRDRVRAVLHVLGFSIGRCDGAGIQMVAADHDGGADLALLHQPVEPRAQLGTLAVFQPADPSR